MVILLISSLSIKVVINNNFHKSLEYKKEDLYNLGNFEKILCLLNKYSKDNMEVICEIRSKGIDRKLMEGMNLEYIKEIEKFHLVYIDKGFRYTTFLRCKNENGVLIFLPLQEKYKGKE